jgi:SRSO17 transposase
MRRQGVRAVTPRRFRVCTTDSHHDLPIAPNRLHLTELQELAAVAGLRWTIEECFQSAKGETGLDQCEARSWHGWHRHMTLSMLALAFLAGLRARLKEAQIAVASDKANKRSLSAVA